MVESDILNFTRKKIVNDELSSLGIGAANLKFGFNKRMDVELITGIYSQDTYKNKTIKDSKNYVQDLTFRYKYNFMGNDSGSFALAIMPLVRTTNFFKEKIELLNCGLLLNAEKDLGFAGLGYTGGLSIFSVKPLLNQFELFSTVSLDYKVVGALHNFIEVSYRYNKAADFLHTYSFDSGFTFTPALNLQFDAGFYFFLPANSPFLFIGGTIRI